MSTLSKLKLSSTKRTKVVEQPEQVVRNKLCTRLEEQLEIAKADIAGEPYVKMQQVFVNDPTTGQRVARQEPKRVRRWFWHDIKGIWYLELRYGNKAIDLGKGKTTIDVGEREKLPETIEVLINAVKEGALDDVLLEAQQDRSKTFRKAQV